MCTIGAVSNINEKGERLSFLMKTIDNPLEIEITYGFFRAAELNNAIFTSIMRQQGINIGMNQHGLAATISYSGYTESDIPVNKANPDLESDTRALANARILAKCKSVDEGIEALKDFVLRYPRQWGSNYLLIDANGEIALLEHHEGKYEYRKYTERGYCGRGNNSHWLLADKQSPEVKLDSLPREEAMENFLKEAYEKIHEGVSSQKIIRKAKSLLSRHSEVASQVGAICIHGLQTPGIRILGDVPCYTSCAVILDIKELVMHYSLGSPCRGKWRTLGLTRQLVEIP